MGQRCIVRGSKRVRNRKNSHETPQKKENEQLEIIYLELGKIHKKLSETKKPITIPLGDTVLDVAHAVGALKRAIYKLISTKTSIKSETYITLHLV